MKTIGLIGGMSWESSLEYERVIHTEVRRRLGGTHSARTLHWTFDFHDIEALQESGEWEAAGAAVLGAARRLEGAGADLLVLCTNTMHRVADEVAEGVSIPLIHIADTTADAVLADNITTVGLMGTSYTMEGDFFRGRLAERGLEVITPGAADRAEVHTVIFDELVRGVLSPDSRRRFLEIIGGLVEAGAEGVIAGCTEIELLVGRGDLDVAYYPTARIHALAAVTAALDPNA